MNVILDWAGTLADDRELTWRLTDRVIRESGGAGVDFETYRSGFTFPVEAFYRRFLPGADMDAIEAAFAAHCRAEYPAGAKLVPGAGDGLACLACRHRLYLFTSLDQEMVEETLEALDIRRYFQAAKGSVRDKSAELPAWLRSLGLSQDETLAIGDMPHDIEAARSAGIAALAVTYGYGSRAALEAAGPEYLAADFPAVLRHLDKMAAAESRHFPVATVGGLIYDDDGRILLVRTRKWSGLYGIPGGKIDYGETMEAAFAREAKEETGLEIGEIAFVLNQDCIEHPEFYRPRHYVLVNFRARARGSRPAVKLNHESDHAVWALPAEALAMPLNGPTRLLLERAGEGKA